MGARHPRPLRRAASIFVLAALLRIGFVFAFPRPLVSDEIDFDRLGRTLEQTGAYTSSGQPTAYRVIGYPAVIAGVYRLFGENPQAVKIFQAILDSTTAVMLLFLVESVPPFQALCSAGLWACFPAAIIFASQLFSETLFTFLLVAAFLLLCRGREDPVGVLLTGLLLGCLVLIKPVALPIALLAPFAVRNLRKAAWTAGVIAISLIPVSVWVVRNAVVLHSPVLTTSTGANLLVGNNQHATGGYSSPEATVHGTSEVSANRKAQAQATRYILEHPVNSALLCIRKVLFLFTSEAELEVGHFSRPSTEGSRLRERLRTVPIGIRLLVSMPSALILILGILGLGGRPADCLTAIFWIAFLTILASTVVFFGGSRFRFPLMPFLAIFAVGFLANLRASMRSLSNRRLALVAVSLAVLACIGVWIVEIRAVYL